MVTSVNQQTLSILHTHTYTRNLLQFVEKVSRSIPIPCVHAHKARETEREKKGRGVN